MKNKINPISYFTEGINQTLLPDKGNSDFKETGLYNNFVKRFEVRTLTGGL